MCAQQVKPGEPLVRLAGLNKTFPGQRALAGVEMEIRSGEIHALVGENGSGKSTLIKILSDYYRPDDGSEVWIRGVPASFGELTLSGPIRTVHQDLGIIGGLSAVDNVGFGGGFESGRFGRVKWAAQAEHTQALLERVTPEKVDLFAPMASAPKLHNTAVAIARVLDDWEDDGLLIFDEPTSALPTEEIDRLMEILRDLQRRGSTIMLVSHALDEVLAIADRITVLRDGRRVETVEASAISEADLVKLMLGDRDMPTRPVQSAAAREARADDSSVPPALKATGLGGIEVDGLDIEVAAGEVLGVTGLLGSGHLELAYLLTGALPAVEGELTVAGDTVDLGAMNPSMAIALGIGFVPADRVKEGLIGECTVAENISLPRLRRFQRGGLLRVPKVNADAMQRTIEAGVRPPDPAARVEVLSGGNKQKVLLAKALAVTSTALVIAEPTVGVDLGAKMDFYQRISAHAQEKGIGVLVCSTDLTDLTAMCDRVLALRNGRIAVELVAEEIAEHEMLAAITGLSADERMAS
jgi:ABC-type sugar transport system ATPase subunit